MNPWDLGVALAGLLAYTLTLAPGLLPADSGEYQATGALLGVAHPPGFALYTLLSWLIARLPVVAPALAINWLSALLAAGTLLLTSRVIRTWTGSAGAGLAGAGMLGTAATFWAQATTANVRMFTAFAVALALAALADYERAVRAGRPAGASLAWLAGALGLAVSHHGSTVFLAAALGLYALVLDGRVLRRPFPTLVWPLVWGLAPFLFWLYFPLRAGAFGSPPNARTWEGFLDQILARGWAGDMLAFATPAALPDRLRVLGVLLTFQWNWVLLALGALGAALLLYRERGRAAALGGAFLVHAFIAITYRAPQTTEYLLPAYVLLAVAAGQAGAWLFRLPAPFRLEAAAPLSAPARAALWRTAARFALAVTAVAGLGWQAAQTYPAYQALAQDTSTRDDALALLDQAPAGALLLANWHWATPLWYLQQVEGRRLDVTVRYVVPRGPSYAQNWLEEAQAALAAPAGPRAVVVTNFFKAEYAASGLRFLPLGPAWEARAAPLREPPAGLTSAAAFGDLEFLGFAPLGSAADEAGLTVAGAARRLTLVTAWRPAGAPRDISFFVQLLGPDGRLYGQSDVFYPAGRYTAGEVLLDRHTLYILPEAPPGPYTLTAGAYTPDGVRVAETTLAALTVPPAAAPAPTANAGRWSIVAADLVGFDVDRSLADAQRLYLHWELGPRAEAGEWAGWPLAVPAGLGYATTALDLPPGDPLPAPLASALRRGAQTAAARYVPFGEDLVLTRATVTPPAVRPGGRVTVELEFLAAHSITHDLTLKLELTGPGWRTQLDTTPVGGGLPTLKWTAGARLRDQYVLTVPTEAAPGPAQLALGWYDAFTQADLPILDPRLAQLGPAALIGMLEVLP